MTGRAHAAAEYEIAPMGVSGWLVRFGEAVTEASNQAALAFHRDLQEHPIQGVVETAPSLISVFVRVDPVHEDLDVVKSELEDRARDLLHAGISLTAKRRWSIPCAFDGPQLAEACDLAGLSQNGAIESILEAELRVLTLGFAPGQPYLGSLPEVWNIPRMSGIAPQVPQGALVVAVRQLIVFANDAPTGWRHIGNAAFRCFDETRENPIALQPGDLLRIVRASPDEIASLRSSGDPLGGATCEILS